MVFLWFSYGFQMLISPNLDDFLRCTFSDLPEVTVAGEWGSKLTAFQQLGAKTPDARWLSFSIGKPLENGGLMGFSGILWDLLSSWWFGTCFSFPYIGDNHPN